MFLQGLDDALLDWLRRAAEQATWVTSVCAGSTILGAAGLLRGRRAASHWQALAILKTMGVDAVSDERVVVDGEVMTSAGVSAGIDMALRLVAEVAGEARAKAITLAIEYAPEPPFATGCTRRRTREPRRGR